MYLDRNGIKAIQARSSKIVGVLSWEMFLAMMKTWRGRSSRRETIESNNS